MVFSHHPALALHLPGSAAIMQPQGFPPAKRTPVSQTSFGKQFLQFVGDSLMIQLLTSHKLGKQYFLGQKQELLPYEVGSRRGGFIRPSCIPG